MSSKLEDVTNAALSLSDSERAALAKHLIDTLEPGVEDSVEQDWLVEAERRYTAYRRKEIETSPAEAAHKEARTRLE